MSNDEYQHKSFFDEDKYPIPYNPGGGFEKQVLCVGIGNTPYNFEFSVAAQNVVNIET